MPFKHCIMLLFGCRMVIQCGIILHRMAIFFYIIYTKYWISLFKMCGKLSKKVKQTDPADLIPIFYKKGLLNKEGRSRFLLYGSMFNQEKSDIRNYKAGVKKEIITDNQYYEIKATYYSKYNLWRQVTAEMGTKYYD